jgi:hypothetical protein
MSDSKQSEYLYDRLRNSNHQAQRYLLSRIGELEEEILELHAARSRALVAEVVLVVVCLLVGYAVGVHYGLG